MFFCRTLAYRCVNGRTRTTTLTLDAAMAGWGGSRDHETMTEQTTKIACVNAPSRSYLIDQSETSGEHCGLVFPAATWTSQQVRKMDLGIPASLPPVSVTRRSECIDTYLPIMLGYFDPVGHVESTLVLTSTNGTFSTKMVAVPEGQLVSIGRLTDPTDSDIVPKFVSAVVSRKHAAFTQQSGKVRLLCDPRGFANVCRDGISFTSRISGPRRARSSLTARPTCSA